MRGVRCFDDRVRAGWICGALRSCGIRPLSVQPPSRIICGVLLKAASKSESSSGETEASPPTHGSAETKTYSCSRIPKEHCRTTYNFVHLVANMSETRVQPSPWATGDDWERHKDEISELYQRNTLKDTLEYMARVYDFHAT